MVETITTVFIKQGSTQIKNRQIYGMKRMIIIKIVLAEVSILNLKDFKFELLSNWFLIYWNN